MCQILGAAVSCAHLMWVGVPLRTPVAREALCRSVWLYLGPGADRDERSIDVAKWWDADRSELRDLIKLDIADNGAAATSDLD